MSRLLFHIRRILLFTDSEISLEPIGESATGEEHPDYQKHAQYEEGDNTTYHVFQPDNCDCATFSAKSPAQHIFQTEAEGKEREEKRQKHSAGNGQHDILHDWKLAFPKKKTHRKNNHGEYHRECTQTEPTSHEKRGQ